MAIEDIIRALDSQADAECGEILDAATAQADAILEDARAEAEKIKSAKLEHARGTSEAKASQLVNAAKLDNKRSLAAARERSIDEVYVAAGEKLAGLRDDASYPALFKALADEAMAGLEGDVVVMVDPADSALASKVASGIGSRATVEASMPTSGGLTVAADGGHVFKRNTLDGRLAKVRKIAQSRVAEILFG